MYTQYTVHTVLAMEEWNGTAIKKQLIQLSYPSRKGWDVAKPLADLLCMVVCSILYSSRSPFHLAISDEENIYLEIL
jgi:hypothetical protein